MQYFRSKDDAAKSLKTLDLGNLNSDTIDFLHATALVLGLPTELDVLRSKLELKIMLPRNSIIKIVFPNCMLTARSLVLL